jgi:hypothetical protein
VSVEYVLEFLEADSSFGPGTKLGELWDVRNVGWSRYDRIPGKAFATVAQSSPLLPLLQPLSTHVRITRITPQQTTEVYNGGFIDYDSTADDVVLDLYDYVTLLSLSRANYRKMYPTASLGSGVVAPEWALARGATDSPLAFVATGTIEDPIGNDEATTITTNAQFGLMDQMRLQLLYDLTEMGRSNTAHHTTFEITRTAPFTFNFWKDRGSVRDIGLVLGGTVSNYRYVPGWTHYRNDLATLGTAVGGGPTEIVKSDPNEAHARGLRQDVFTIRTVLGVAGASTEYDQQQAVAQRVLKSMTQAQPGLALKLVRGYLDPFVGFDICDKMPVEIANGVDTITGSWRLAGVRGFYDESGEALTLIVAPVVT